MWMSPLIVELDDNERLIAVSEQEVMKHLVAMAAREGPESQP